MRPAFCYWGFRAADGRDDGPAGEAIVRAAAALELLHTMAIVHDDLIDGAKERRGVPTTEVWFAEHAAERDILGDPSEHGRSMAILVGDVCAVWADELLDGCGFDAEAVARARIRYDEMRVGMAVGQVLGAGGAAGDPRSPAAPPREGAATRSRDRSGSARPSRAARRRPTRRSRGSAGRWGRRSNCATTSRTATPRQV